VRRPTHILVRLRLIGMVLVVIVLGADPAFGQRRSQRPIQSGQIPVPRMLPTDQEVADTTIDTVLRRLVARLEDPSYEAREAAMEILLTTPVDLTQLCAVLAQDDLAIEPRYRLLEVLDKQLRRLPRGALGIQMGWQMVGQEAGVQVTNLITGLPAEKVLELGDLITHVDGVRLKHRNDLIVLVQSKRPGDEAQLTLIRTRTNDSGERMLDTLEIPLRLGSAEQLRDPDTGVINRPTAVEQARSRESQRARAEYAPRPVLAEVVGAEDLGLFGARDAYAASLEEIDAVPEVKALLRDRELVQRGFLPLTERRIDEWRSQLKRLQIAAMRSDLSPADRTFAQRVAARYEELLLGDR